MPSTGKSLDGHDPRQVAGARRPGAFVLPRPSIWTYLSLRRRAQRPLKTDPGAIFPPKTTKNPLWDDLKGLWYTGDEEL